MAAGLKRKVPSSEPAPGPAPKARKAILDGAKAAPAAAAEDMTAQLARIAASGQTPFQKSVLNLLCRIPPGQFSTYGLVSAHLGSSPRAVGNALRQNPFAPEVPCHRVVATGGNLGGFKGKWPRDGVGITLDEKRMLLRKEGVRFDGKGRVLGTPFMMFEKDEAKSGEGVTN